MKDFKTKLSSIEKDLGLDIPYRYGTARRVSNCWHYSTDGNFKDVIFTDEEDFKAAMNRIASLLLKYDVVILAFCLMDNHVHFVIYGTQEESLGFMTEFIRQTSIYFSSRHGLRKALRRIPLTQNAIEDENYLKNVICYNCLNAPVGGLKYTFYDYPWCSGAVSMRSGSVNLPVWALDIADDKVMKALGYGRISELTVRDKEALLISEGIPGDWITYNGWVLPVNYIPVDIVDRIFGSHRAFTFFCSLNKEKAEDIRNHEGISGAVRISDAELRQYKAEKCQAMFGTKSSYSLNVDQRIQLAKALQRQYLCSHKQIARMVGMRLCDLDKFL